MKTPDYLNLTRQGGARGRLILLRERCARSLKNSLPSGMQYATYATWREARLYRLDNWEAAYGVGLSHGGDDTYYTFDKDAFRDVRWADEIEHSAVDNIGWFNDDSQDSGNVTRGMVGRLTHGRYIAGHCDTMGGCCTWSARVFDRERWAAQSADDQARQTAEDQRDAIFREEVEQAEREAAFEAEESLFWAERDVRTVKE